MANMHIHTYMDRAFVAHWDNWMTVNQFLWYAHLKTNQQVLNTRRGNFWEIETIARADAENDSTGWHPLPSTTSMETRNHETNWII